MAPWRLIRNNVVNKALGYGYPTAKAGENSAATRNYVLDHGVRTRSSKH